MGNCLVMEKKVIKIMRNDGQVVEYKGPMKVHHILTQFSNHYSLFDSLSNTSHLHPQSNLLCGRLYYLLPKETTTTITKDKIKIKKKVTFANQEEDKVKDCNQENTTKDKSVNVVRVKMVVTKQELEKLLQGGSIHEIVYRSLAKEQLSNDDNDDECLKVWRPLLDSIPESG